MYTPREGLYIRRLLNCEKKKKRIVTFKTLEGKIFVFAWGGGNMVVNYGIIKRVISRKWLVVERKGAKLEPRG